MSHRADVRAGWVRALATTNSEDPGKVTFQITGGFFGLSGTPYPCEVGVYLAWGVKNQSAGAFEGVVAGTLIPSVPTKIVTSTQNTGKGVVDFYLTTSRPAILAPHTTITVG